jgi:hypothetical protein
MRTPTIFFIAVCCAGTHRPVHPPVCGRTEVNAWPRLDLRGGTPDLGVTNLDGDLISSHMDSVRALKDLTVGVRNGKYSVMTAKRRAELMIMGSNPTESSKILEVTDRTTRI